MLSTLTPLSRPPRSDDRDQRLSADKRRANDLKHREEAVAAERQQLAEERRKLAREKTEWEEQQEERAEQLRIEQRTERRRTEAIEMAGDLRHDRDNNEPGYTAGLILQAARKAKGELPEAPLSGMAADIIRAGKIRRGEAVADTVMPQNPVARAITISGRRARGEAVSESDAAFLSAFLQKIGPRA